LQAFTDKSLETSEGKSWLKEEQASQGDARWAPYTLTLEEPNLNTAREKNVLKAEMKGLYY
jgi:hypothetical protein